MGTEKRGLGVEDKWVGGYEPALIYLWGEE